MTSSITRSKKTDIDNLIDNDKIIWSIIDRYFQDNKNILIKHHLNSFNQFFDKTIKNIFKEKNPIKILKELILIFYESTHNILQGYSPVAQWQSKRLLTAGS